MAACTTANATATATNFCCKRQHQSRRCVSVDVDVNVGSTAVIGRNVILQIYSAFVLITLLSASVVIVESAAVFG